MAYTKVYWRPTEVPTGALLVLAIISLSGLFMVETMRSEDTIADYGTMLAAARQTQQSMAYIGELRQEIRRIDADVDPTESGVIGVSVKFSDFSKWAPSCQANHDQSKLGPRLL